MTEKKGLSGPDLRRGISLTELTDGSMLQGHAKGELILVARRGDDHSPIRAICTHYGASLFTGIIVDDTMRCPGVTRASVFARERRCARRRLIW
jgi:nitrite reductase/ring-hydroxylating ferredoxin subunit